jgi:thiol:disulfide interchange protein DsbC
MQLQRWFFSLVFLAVLPGLVYAQEAAIQKRLVDKLSDFPPILRISPSPYKGLYEVVTKNYDIYYTDLEANFLLNGDLIDTRTLKNQTEASLDKLLAIAFDKLPVKDAFTIVRGDGKRKLAVFEDPNCGYCKHFEADLQKVNNITVYLFLLPLLGPDSTEKSKNIWCSKNRAKAWQDWMLNNEPAPSAQCDTSALARNVELARKYRLTGTPTLVFSNGSRLAGAIDQSRLEQLLKARS